MGFRGMAKVMLEPQLMLIAVGGGWMVGVFNVWSGSFDQILGAASNTSKAQHDGGFWLEPDERFGATSASIISFSSTGVYPVWMCTFSNWYFVYSRESLWLVVSLDDLCSFCPLA